LSSTAVAPTSVSSFSIKSEAASNSPFGIFSLFQYSIGERKCPQSGIAILCKMHFSCFPIDLADLTQPIINDTETSQKSLQRQNYQHVYMRMEIWTKMMQSIINQLMLQIIVMGSLFYFILIFFFFFFWWWNFLTLKKKLI
jgi:hypothetical protein